MAVQLVHQEDLREEGRKGRKKNHQRGGSGLEPLEASPGPHLEGEQRNHDGHPADRHGDVSPPLLGDDVDGAEEKDRPDDVVEDDEAQEGHEDPQWHAHHLTKDGHKSESSLKF